VSSANRIRCALLGWQAAPFEAGPTQYRVLSVPGDENGFGGMMEMNGEWAGIPTHWSIYLHVVDVDTIVERAQALGGTVVVPAFDVAGVGRIARLDDPSGAGFYVMTPSPQG
jgi:uncharacterized protein